MTKDKNQQRQQRIWYQNRCQQQQEDAHQYQRHFEEARYHQRHLVCEKICHKDPMTRIHLIPGVSINPRYINIREHDVNTGETQEFHFDARYRNIRFVAETNSWVPVIIDLTK